MKDKRVKFKLTPGITKEQLIYELMKPAIQAFVNCLDFDEEKVTTQKGVISLLFRLKEA